MGLSKSRYVKFCQCEKLLWLSVYKPEEATEDPSAQQLIETGHEVGQLAKGLYGKYVETTSYTEDGHLDITAMIRKTQEFLAKGEKNICEAAFSYQGNYCAVDILRKVKGGYSIYEVKSSTAVKQEYIFYIEPVSGLNSKNLNAILIADNSTSINYNEIELRLILKAD